MNKVGPYSNLVDADLPQLLDTPLIGVRYSVLLSRVTSVGVYETACSDSAPGGCLPIGASRFMASLTEYAPRGGFGLVLQNPYLCGVASVSTKTWQIALMLTLAQFSSLGGLLFGYDQGVISGVITMESFGARFPHVFSDSGFKGWFVSTLLLGRQSSSGERSMKLKYGSCVAWIIDQWSRC